MLGKLTVSKKTFRLLIAGVLLSLAMMDPSYGSDGLNKHINAERPDIFNTIVSGKVTDSSGAALRGVTVQVQGSEVNTITDAEGNFSISVPDHLNVLVFTFVGLGKQEIKINKRSHVSVQMLAAAGNLAEVVVTALGIERKKETLGFVTQKVSGEQLNEAPSSNFVNNISGKVAGVHVSGAGGVGSSARITIRGESSLSLQSNQPLFVIDGVPVANDGVNNTSGNADYGNSSAEINPQDIESMNVLKGPAAAALYGSRAANGAIVITTKKGTSRRGIGLSFTMGFNQERVARLPKFQNDFGQGNNGVYEGSNFGASWSIYPDGEQDSYDESWGPRMNVGTSENQFDSPTTNGYRGADVAINNRGDIIATPWVSQPNNIRDFFDKGHKNYYNLALTGGNDKSNYRLSLTSMDEKGVIPNNDLKRYQVGLNSSYRLTSKLTSSINFNYVKQQSDNRPDNGYGRNTFMYFFTWMGRNVNMDGLRDYWQPGLTGLRQFQYNYGENHNNPIFLMHEVTKGQDKNRLYGNIALDYAATDHLKFKLRTAADYFNDFRPMKWAVSTVDYENGRYEEVRLDYQERNTDFLASYNNEVAGGDIAYTVSAGANRFDQSGRSQSAAAPQLLVPGVYNLANTASPITAGSYEYQKRINSVYGTANISYKDLVHLDFTARNDWSSTLPEGNNSYFYPSVSTNANVKDIFSLPGSISKARVRLSWAQVGNDAGPYQIKNTYGYGSPWGANYSLVGGSSLMNNDLKPEITTSIEVGTSIGFFKNRLSFDLTYYDIRSKNQIMALPMVRSSGAVSRIINAGEIKNNGIEVMLSAEPVRLPNSLSWSFNINVSRNIGKVVSLTEEVDKIVQSAPGEDASIQARVGERMGAIYGPGYQRVQEGKMKGEIIVFSNGQPRGTTEDIYLGNYNPDWIGSVYNKVGYKNFTLGFLFAGQYGGKFISRFYNKANGAGQLIESAAGRSARAPGTEYDELYYVVGAADMGNNVYEPNSTSTDGTYSTGIYGTNVRNFIKRPLDHISEAQLFDATYFKLRELSLGYTIPAAWLGKKVVKGATVSLYGRNLLLFTPKSNQHFDPEVATATQGNGLVPGFENMSTPSTREMGVSLNVNF